MKQIEDTTDMEGGENTPPTTVLATAGPSAVSTIGNFDLPLDGNMEKKLGQEKTMHFLPPANITAVKAAAGSDNVQGISQVPTNGKPSRSQPPKQVDGNGSSLPAPLLQRGNAEVPPSQPGALAVGGSEDALDISINNHQANASEGSQPTSSGTTPAGAPRDLVVASLVYPEDQNPQLPQASAASSAERAERLQKTREWKRNVALAVIAFITVAIVLVVLLVVTQNKGGKSRPASVETTVAPSLGPTHQIPTLEEYIKSLFPASTWEAWKDPSSPQSLAYEWLMEDIPHLLRLDIWSNDTQTMLLEPYDGALSDSTITRIYQRFALVALYYSTGGEAWLNQDNWLDHTVSECLWETSPFFHNQPIFADWFHGAFAYYLNMSEPMPPTCDPMEELYYEHLWLDFNNLDGTLPNELYLMTTLKSFSSIFNFIKGTLSTQIGLLTNLEGLGLRNNGNSVIGPWENAIGPSIPSEIGLLSNLEVISTSYLNLKGSFPTEFWSLTKLKHLDLIFSPELTGSLPTEIGLMTDMRWLNWFTCDYSGTVPSEVGLLSHLVWIGFGGSIALERGRMSGTIPTELGTLPDLNAMIFMHSSFTGTIPSQLGLLRGLRRFRIYNTDMTGTIPSELGLAAFDGYVSIEYSNFSGHIPSQLGLLTEVKDLGLRGNQLTGIIPSQLGLITDLAYLLLQNNELTGSIPMQLGVLQPFMHTIEIHNTGITGEVPQHLCNLNDTCLETITGSVFKCPSETGIQFNCTNTLCGCGCLC